MKTFRLLFVNIFLFTISFSQIIINHNNTDITKIPESAILSAKQKLHICYGHTSHGSQLTNGMTGLVKFANDGGKGLSLPTDIFKWNKGGTNGALDLHDGGMGGDVGYYPAWVDFTKSYLDNSANSKTNVIMWSWCGQVDDKYKNNKLLSEYLEPMAQLEKDYPNVTFVYMTGHLDHWDDANNKAANQAIRDYCITNKKVLFDFADIESYDPDGKYFEFSNDNCDYYQSANGNLLGNWAIEWQNKKVENVDWYNCSSAHSQPLNANLKAFATWWMFARIAGWDGNTTSIENNVLPLQYSLEQNYPNPFNPSTVINFYIAEQCFVVLKVYDITGSEITTLINENKNAGYHSIKFETNKLNLASGIYIYKIITNKFVESKKMVLLR